jgi:hypothetical protein
MAYQFTGTSSRYLSTPATTLTAPPLTIAAWCYQSSLATGTIASASPATGNYVGILSLVGGPIRLVFGSRDVDTTTSATAGTWNHAAGVYASTTSKTAYLNGVGNTDTSSLGASIISAPAALVGARRLNGGLAVYYTGLIAEVGIWDVALTPEEIASLAKGMTCDKVRPQSLVYYAPLVRDLQDVRGGLTITNNNGATVANHPRVYA